MSNKNTNVVTVVGTITSEKTFSHEIFGEKFYSYDLTIKRLSDCEDVIPVFVSERVTNLEDLVPGVKVKITGRYCSFNKHMEGNERNRLILSIFARTIEKVDNEEHDINEIELEGFVCKMPKYRQTPLGREIADVLIAVNRPYGKSDYIPCICWGRNAKYAETFKVGDKVKFTGRIQSRTYTKKISETEVETKIAYEVSVSKLVFEETSKDTTKETVETE